MAKDSPMKFTVRGLRQPKRGRGVFEHEADDPLAGLEECLALTDYPAPDPIITWETKDGDAVSHLAALDVDWHRSASSPPPADWWYDALVSDSPVRPSLYWRTHGGGLRAIFLPCFPLGATRIAALFAAWNLHERYGPRQAPFAGITGIELKTDTRHPAYPRTGDGAKCGPVRRGGGSDVLRAMWSLLDGETDEPDEDAVADWLRERGMEFGKRYPHSRCPIKPSNKENRDPVIVLDGGIYCHACDSEGRGFRSWRSLLSVRPGARRRNVVFDMVKHVTHWTHAKHILRAEWPYLFSLAPDVAQLAYQSLLLLRHCPGVKEGRVRNTKHSRGVCRWIKGVFSDIPMVRGRDRWLNSADLSTVYTGRPLEWLFNSIPAAKYVDPETGETKLSCRKYGILLSGIDLSPHGYPPVLPLIGIDLRGKEYVWNLRAGIVADVDRGAVRVVVEAKEAPFRERTKDCLPEDEVRRELERQFPGLNYNFLKLLIAAKGYSQRQPDLPPFIFVHGVTRSGKNATVDLAAEIACDRVYTPAGTPKDGDEFMRFVGKACDAYGYLFIDEVTKDTRFTPDDLQARILAIRGGGQFRELQTGPRTFGLIPAVVLADVHQPPIFRESAQLASRVVTVSLGDGANGINWRETCDTGDIRGWRAGGFGKNALIADSLVTIVLRDVMSKHETFPAAAAALGFPLMRDADDGIDRYAGHRELFKVVCGLPAKPVPARWSGPGWHVCRMNDSSPLFPALQAACPDLANPQRLKEVPWKHIIGCDREIRCDVDRHGQHLAIRFRDGDPRSPSTRFNGDLRPSAPAVAPAAGPLPWHDPAFAKRLAECCQAYNL
jgi:hypothetical protein